MGDQSRIGDLLDIAIQRQSRNIGFEPFNNRARLCAGSQVGFFKGYFLPRFLLPLGSENGEQFPIGLPGCGVCSEDQFDRSVSI
jgi:hypothetical protein